MLLWHPLTYLFNKSSSWLTYETGLYHLILLITLFLMTLIYNYGLLTQCI